MCACVCVCVLSLVNAGSFWSLINEWVPLSHHTEPKPLSTISTETFEWAQPAGVTVRSPRV